MQHILHQGDDILFPLEELAIVLFSFTRVTQMYREYGRGLVCSNSFSMHALRHRSSIKDLYSVIFACCPSSIKFDIVWSRFQVNLQ